MCTLWDKWRREHSATSSVHFVQVKLERIIRSESYVHVQLLQNALSSVSDRMGMLVLQYACTFYGIFRNIDLVCVCVSNFHHSVLDWH